MVLSPVVHQKYVNGKNRKTQQKSKQKKKQKRKAEHHPETVIRQA